MEKCRTLEESADSIFRLGAKNKRKKLGTYLKKHTA
jgi:hypothetical protein